MTVAASFVGETEEIEHPLGVVQSLISALKAQGAEHFDPVRLRYLEALATKSLQQQEPVRQILENKLLADITDFQQRFEARKAEYSRLVEKFAALHPEQTEKISDLLLRSEFNAIKRMIARSEQTPKLNLFAEITANLSSAVTLEAEPFAVNSATHSFAETFRQQEVSELLRNESIAVPAARSTKTALPELKSMQLFRKDWAKITAAKRAKQTIAAEPEHAGPLNSHMLIIRSLAMMHDISPEYLHRFMAYADTLLWLEQANSKKEAVVEKPPVRRSKKKH